MKNKKLLIIIAAFAVLAVAIIVMIVVFSVKDAHIVCHEFSGSQIVATDDAPTANDVLEFSKGKSVVFLSKDKLLADLNEKHTQWHAFAVVKNFPNKLEVHFVKRVAVAKIDIGGNMVFVDSFGYVMEAPEEGKHIDITSVFDRRDVKVQQVGKPLTFAEEVNNLRLKQVLTAIVATWQCNVELADIPQILGEENVFTFDVDGNLEVNMLMGAKIRIMLGGEDFTTKITNGLIKAYSVYYTDNLNNEPLAGVVITVSKEGVVTSNQGK